jgi:archaeosine-15-forming tRNA-guanine transglycosylase
MEEKIRNLIEGEVLKLGVSIDSVEYVKEGSNYFLRIVIDRDEPIDIDKCVEVTNVINKSDVGKWFKDKIVAIGDGNNDAEMMEKADIGIGFGAIRDIAPAVLERASHAIYTEKKLCEFLNDLVGDIWE